MFRGVSTKVSRSYAFGLLIGFVLRLNLLRVQVRGKFRGVSRKVCRSLFWIFDRIGLRGPKLAAEAQNWLLNLNSSNNQNWLQKAKNWLHKAKVVSEARAGFKRTKLASEGQNLLQRPKSEGPKLQGAKLASEAQTGRGRPKICFRSQNWLEKAKIVFKAHFGLGRHKIGFRRQGPNWLQRHKLA